MRNSFLTIFASGLLVAGLLSFTEPYHPQDAQTRDRQRNKSRTTDTMSDTRINRSNRPAMQRTDSLPMPVPQPRVPVPVPDSIPNPVN